MRKHVTPADPTASILDLLHGGFLPPTGLDVEYTPYWIGLAVRGDIVVSDPIGDGGPPAPLPDASQISGAGFFLRVSGVERLFSVADLQTILTPLLGGSPPADTTAPTITVSPSQTVAENTAFSLTLSANEAVTWAKVGGADAALFTLSGNTLTLPARDFEAPTDANGDNAYVVQVRATDATGNASTLTITVTVTDVNEVTKPVNSAVPTISGTPQVGQTLTASTGTWSGSPTSYTYQWNRAGTAISGATTASYSPAAADVGKTLTVTVVANNAGGASLPATSAATAAVTAAPSGSNPGQISTDLSDPNSIGPRV